MSCPAQTAFIVSGRAHDSGSECGGAVPEPADPVGAEAEQQLSVRVSPAEDAAERLPLDLDQHREHHEPQPDRHRQADGHDLHRVERGRRRGRVVADEDSDDHHQHDPHRQEAVDDGQASDHRAAAVVCCRAAGGGRGRLCCSRRALCSWQPVDGAMPDAVVLMIACVCRLALHQCRGRRRLLRVAAQCSSRAGPCSDVRIAAQSTEAVLEPMAAGRTRRPALHSPVQTKRRLVRAVACVRGVLLIQAAVHVRVVHAARAARAGLSRRSRFHGGLIEIMLRHAVVQRGEVCNSGARGGDEQSGRRRERREMASVPRTRSVRPKSRPHNDGTA